MSEPEIKSMNVAIKTVVIDGRKITKSIFNQIEFKRCFNQNIDFIGTEWLGYINDKEGKYLLWTYQDRLWKTNLGEYYKLRKISDSAKFEDVEWFCRLTGIEPNDNFESSKLPGRIDDHSKYDQLIDKVFSFLKMIGERQLFI